MANRRMINSDLFSDDVFMELDDLTRLVWIGLIVMSADDQGRLQDNELLIKSQIFPMDNKAPVKVKASLDILERHSMIHRYQKGEKNLIQIVNWWKHQTPSWASPSNYPAPDNWVDREKYHAAESKIVTTNWDKSGGFNKLHSPLHNPLHSPLRSDQVTELVGKERREDKNTSKSESENTDEDTVETPEGGTVTSSQSQKILSITDHIQKTGAQIKPDDEQAIKQLVAVFKLPDIHDAIDHMAAHTNRPNVGYLRKVLDGWFNERKIQKVYS